MIVMTSAHMKTMIRPSLTRCRQARGYQDINKVRAGRKEMRSQSRKQEKKVNPDAMLSNARQLALYFEHIEMTNKS